MKQKFFLAISSLLLATGVASAKAPSRSYTLAICTSAEPRGLTEPLVVLSSGSVYFLTWKEAHLPEPAGVDSYPVVDFKTVDVGHIGHLAKQASTSIKTNVRPIKGRQTVLKMDNNMQPTEVAYELAGLEVETELLYADEGNVRRTYKLSIPAGSNKVELGYTQESPDGATGAGRIDMHCEMRKSFVR